MKKQDDQMSIDFRKVLIVRNHWSPDWWHLEYSDGTDFNPADWTNPDVWSDEYENHPDQCPAGFDSPEEAGQFALKYGIHAVMEDEDNL